MKSLLRAVALSVCLAGALHAEENWILRHDGRRLFKVVETGLFLEKYVAIGEVGALLTSVDGTRWNSRINITGFTSLVDLVWTGNLLLGVAANGDVVTTPNGLNWNFEFVPRNLDARKLVWTGTEAFSFTGRADSVVAIPLQGRIEIVPTHCPANSVFLDAFWDGRQVVLHWASNGMDSLSTSPDGRVWTKVPTSRIRNMRSMLVLDSLYLGRIGDTLLESRDLVSWSPRGRMVDSAGSAFLPDTLVHAFNRFWSGSTQQGRVYSSADGLRWKVVVNLPGNQAIGSLSRTNQGLFALGKGGLLLAKFEAFADWVLYREGMASSLEGVVWDGAKLVVKGKNNAHLESGEGTLWNVVDGRYAPASTGTSALIWTGSQAYGVRPDSRLKREGDPQGLIDKTFLDGYWDGQEIRLVGEQGALARSRDGVLWTEDFVPWKAALQGGVFADGLHVVVADTLLATSPDAKNWTRQNLSAGRHLRSVAWGGGTWVAVGPSTLLTSSDAVTWKSPLLQVPKLRMVRYLGGQFVAVGSQGTVMTSVDGATWKTISVGIDLELDDVAWTGVALVAVGQYGTIFTNGNPVVPITGVRAPMLRSPERISVRGRQLLLPAWVEKVTLVLANGQSRRSLVPVLGRVDLEDLPQGLWIAKASGGGGSRSLRFVR
ncbi:MAG: hypothetical protein IPK50_01475 [Fibrobacterota bacterium]|nr:MAG: hypothetical protein IPK50_01475 [Fibrobacterota bacterium]